MKKNLKIKEIGRIVAIAGSILKIKGLPSIKIGEVVSVGKEKALILKFGREFTSALIYEDFVFALALGNPENIKIGQQVERRGEILKIPVGEALLGRIVDPLGKDLETGRVVKGVENRLLERIPPEITQRGLVREPLETGIKVIDALFPIGRGQRELILGDRKTGKTNIAIDTILNQKDVICIYCSIGQKRTEVVEIIRRLREFGAQRYTIFVCASSSDPLVLQYIAPFSAMVMAEYFRDKGKDVLIVFDDLLKHAWAWREITLLLRFPPGREAYPGDIFYLHARLLERAGKLSDELGGGSITALPICETKEGDITEYIPTNLISITDGQLYLDSDLFQKGVKPAINIGLSVSRIGAHAQRKYIKEVTQGLKLILSQHKELKKLVQLETKLSDESREKFRRAEILLEIFKQEKHELVDTLDQSIMYHIILSGYLDDLEIDRVKDFEEKFYEFLNDLYPEVKKSLFRNGWTEKVKKEIQELMKKFKENF
ncbi:F0F1 ATP synthase subunit alpha [bacterium]|nr:F0F1 ATP synthase subunit alpha [bacterium]